MNDNNNNNTFSVYMEPECIGEALELYFIAKQIISPDRKITSFNIPVELDEDGNVPIRVVLNATTGLN